MYVPTIRVQLVQTIKLRPGECVVAEGKLVGEGVGGERVQFSSGAENEDESTRMLQQVMLRESDQQLQERIGVQIAGTLIQPSSDGSAQVLLTNRHSLSQD